MAPSADDDNTSPAPTAIPARDGKRKPARPQAARRGTPPRPVASGRPAGNRRSAWAHKRRRTQTLLAAGAIVLVVAVVAVFIVAKGSGRAKSNTVSTAVSASTLDSLTSAVSLQQMRAAASNYPLTYGGYPTVTSDPPITTKGKPELLYVGAEYCPFCATERWPLVLALSKFGTFANLSSVHSEASDVFGNTPTFSFYKSTYTSKYLTFRAVETETVDREPLQPLTAAQTKLLDRYDVAANGDRGDIPFIDFNGQAIISGAEYDPGLLGGTETTTSKMTFAEVIASIQGGQSKLASNVTADAGVIVSMICRMTGGQPGNVCSLFPKPITS